MRGGRDVEGLGVVWFTAIVVDTQSKETMFLNFFVKCGCPVLLQNPRLKLRVPAAMTFIYVSCLTLHSKDYQSSASKSVLKIFITQELVVVSLVAVILCAIGRGCRWECYPRERGLT